MPPTFYNLSSLFSRRRRIGFLVVAQVSPEIDDGRHDLFREPREFWHEYRDEPPAVRAFVGHVATGRGDGVGVVGGGGVELRVSWLHPIRSIRLREWRASPQEHGEDMLLSAAHHFNWPYLQSRCLREE